MSRRVSPCSQNGHKPSDLFIGLNQLVCPKSTLPLISVLVLVAALAGFTSAAKAEPSSSSPSSRNETLAEKFDRTYFATDPDFFHNRSIGRQLDVILGFGMLTRDGFTEHEIARDAKLLHQLYKDSLQQQVNGQETTRTSDLPNPYTTSVNRQ